MGTAIKHPDRVKPRCSNASECMPGCH